MSSEPDYTYNDWSVKPDPAHQPMFLRIVVDYLRQAPGKVVLDAGCGNASFSSSLAAEGFTVYGIDLSQSGIDVARVEHPEVTVAKASVYDDLAAVFPDRHSFDAVVSVEVIEHLYSPRQFADRVHDALSPGGLFIVTTPYWGYLKNIVRAVTNRMDRALTPLWDGGHIKHWSRRTLGRLYADQGFEVIGFTGAGRPIPGLWNAMVMVGRKR